MGNEIFTQYFKNNTWRGKESVSGPGSDYEQTKYLIPELSLLIKELKIKTILDVPCGDFNWMKRVDLSNVNYVGGDIVQDLIKLNSKKYQSETIKFKVIDLVNDPLDTVDLIIVRDCLVHLPHSDVIKAINNIKKSNSKYLLTTNFLWESTKNNMDIKLGLWRRLNLMQEPYNFKFPEKIIIEGNRQSHDHDKTMSLWKVKDLPSFKELNG